MYMRKLIFPLIMVFALTISVPMQADNETKKECCKAKKENCEKKESACCKDKKENCEKKENASCDKKKKEKACCSKKKDDAAAKTKSCGKKN